MSIRHLLLSMIAVLTLLALGIGAREVVNTRERLAAIDWLEHSNHVSGLVQRASGALARERGITTIALSRPDRRADDAAPTTQTIDVLRSEADAHIAALVAETPNTARLSPDHPLVSQLAGIRALHSELQAYRDAVDASLAGIDVDLDIAPQRWVALVSNFIDVLHQTISITASPAPGGGSASVQPLIRDALFTLAEHLGQERAIIAAALSREAQLGPTELRELEHYRANILHTWKRADGLLDDFERTPQIEAAIDRFWTGLFVHYEDLRDSVVTASERGQPYPVSDGEWFAQATRGIDAVLALSDTLGEEIDRRAERLRAEASRALTLSLLALAALITAFGVAVALIRRRVLRPLGELERAVAAISAGDLSPHIVAGGDDEFGRLARGFEHMRESLASAERERETTLAEMRKLSTAIEHSVSSVIITDERGIVEYTNPQFTLTSGYQVDEVRGRHVGILKSGYTPPTHYQGLWETLQSGKAWKGELLNRRKDGELYWEAVSISPIRDKAGKIIHFISIQHDISDRKRIEARLDFISSYDPLTRLPNRALLNQRFSEARATARKRGSRLALIALGVRHFKRLNDSLGHEIGDRLLCEIATRLTHATRETDTVSRLSGSEFALILDNIGDAAEVSERTTAILQDLRKPLCVDEHVLQPTLHAGISILPDDGETLDQLLTSASMALHQAEHEGSTPLMFYTPALNADAQARLALESALRMALETNRLELHYQPRIDLRTGRIIGAEALARWRHPETLEYIPPDRFIRISEESGLIHPLGQWVLNEACEQNRRWQKAGLPRIPVSVNVSPLQLQQRGLPDQISEVLARTGLEPEDLEIELTETTVMESPEEAAVALHLLKSLGVRLAIDDFGTGYSSLAYLNRFPVDLLKIDRSFISSLESDPSAATIASSVIALAHRMGLRVVAEGVENLAQLQFLHRQSCDEIQGFYFSPALPPHAFAELLRSTRTLTIPVTSS
ncbi:MAG: EAL domain-containing protein [Azoarcus sp.]|nr:EAL domain-containing protein [Azoarcus sp.]